MSWLLPRLVGIGHAMDLMLSARLVRAPEALAMMLVNSVVPAGDLIAEAKG
jgi:enoyl-CoA hydratase/carnithine racemase